MKHLLFGLACSILLAALGELVPPGTFPPWPLAAIAVVLAAPVTMEILERRRRSRAKSRGEPEGVEEESHAGPWIATIVVGQAIILGPLGWTTWVLDVLEWRGRSPVTLLFLLAPAAALALAMAPAALRATVPPRGAERLREPPAFWFLSRFRLLAVPVVVLVLALALAEHLQPFPARGYFLEVRPATTAVLAALGTVAAFVLAPLIAIAAVPTRRVPEEGLGRDLRILRRRIRKSFATIRVAEGPCGAVLNAYALGIIPRTRVVLLTRALWEYLRPAEIRAVFCHEVAHVRCRHGIYHLLMALTFLAAVGALSGLFEEGRSWLIVAGLGVVFWASWRSLSGIASRRFELEADLVGAEILGKRRYIEALEHLVAALGPAANHDDHRHDSLAKRLEVATLVAADPAVAARIRRHSLHARRAILGVAALCIAALVWHVQAEAGRPPKTLAVERARVALARADELRGLPSVSRPADPPPASSVGWLSRSPERVRREYREAVGAAIAEMQLAGIGLPAGEASNRAGGDVASPAAEASGLGGRAAAHAAVVRALPGPREI